MKIYIGADHRGFKLKEKLKSWLLEEKTPIEDLGAFDYESIDDYPFIAQKVAETVASDFDKDLTDSKGIIICGSGVGVDIVANKVKHIRSGLAAKAEQIRKARVDDDINVLALPADYLSESEAIEITRIFLKTPFSNEDKKLRRIEEINNIENEQ